MSTSTTEYHGIDADLGRIQEHLAAYGELWFNADAYPELDRELLRASQFPEAFEELEATKQVLSAATRLTVPWHNARLTIDPITASLLRTAERAVKDQALAAWRNATEAYANGLHG